MDFYVVVQERTEETAKTVIDGLQNNRSFEYMAPRTEPDENVVMGEGTSSWEMNAKGTNPPDAGLKF